MKAGQNDPCPCGSGKKYKKCCLLEDRAAIATEQATMAQAASRPPDTSRAPQASALLTVAPAPVASKASEPVKPRDPIAEKADRCWEKFQSATGEDRIAV